MANLGRLRITVLDTLGNAISGASVEVRRQGATCNGAQSGSPLTVDAVNGIVATDEIVQGTGTTQRTVSAVTATTVTCGAGFTVSDDERLSIVSGLPSLYVDAQSNEAASNPLTTNSRGMAECYVLGGFYDVHVSGGGATTTLYQDVATERSDSDRSNAFTTGSLVVLKHDTLRAMAAGDKLLELANAGTTEFTIAGDGEIVAGTAGATHSLTGSLAVSTTLTAGTGVTSTTGDIQATAGILKGRRIHGNLGTALVAGDFSLSAGWGSTASLALNDAGNEFDSRGMVGITANGAGVAANPSVTLTFKDGAFPDKPRIVAMRTNSTAPSTGFWISNPTATDVRFDFIGLPVAGSEYGIVWITLG